MGLTLSFEYKNFDITSVSRASLGNYASNRMEAASNYTQITNLNRLSNVHRSYLDTRLTVFLIKIMSVIIMYKMHHSSEWII